MRIILAVFIGRLAAPTPTGRVVLPTGSRADFEAFFSAMLALFVAFFVARRVVLADRPAVFAECLLITSI